MNQSASLKLICCVTFSEQDLVTSDIMKENKENTFSRLTASG